MIGGRNLQLEAASSNPRIERKTQIILVAILSKNSAVRADRRDAEAFLNIFPVNNLVLLLRNDDYVLEFTVSNDRSQARLNTEGTKHCGLLLVAIGQALADDLFNALDARGFPFHGSRGD